MRARRAIFIAADRICGIGTAGTLGSFRNGGWGSRKQGGIQAGSCGACGACTASPPTRHSRNGGRAHMIELLPATRMLLRHVTQTLGVHDIVRVHHDIVHVHHCAV